MKTVLKILYIVRSAVAMFMMMALAYLFTNYLDGDIGVVVWSFLIIAPLLSMILTRTAMKRVTASLEVPTYIAKGKRFSVKVLLKGGGRLPIPFVRCHVQQTANFQPDDPRPVQCAMMPARPLEITSGMTASYAGCGTILLSHLVISDYLGMYQYPLKTLPPVVKVGVIPEIPSLTGAGVLLRSISDAVLTQDEEEEETAAVYSSVSMPGYVHRDYVPGDNLRRINWKLSAKRNRLMVRMDEAAATVRPSVILDLQTENSPELLRMRETLMEGALGILMLLVQQGIACSLRYASEGVWHCLVLENEEAVRTAAVEIASADFRHGENRLDSAATLEKAGAYLVYTASPDGECEQAMQNLRAQGEVCCVVPQALPLPSLSGADAVWQLAEDFQMTALQK